MIFFLRAIFMYIFIKCIMSAVRNVLLKDDEILALIFLNPNLWTIMKIPT